MDLKPYKVAIAQGDGLVARVGDVVMYIADATEEAAPLVASVDAAAEGTDDLGANVVKRLAAVAFSDGSSKIPPFGVVASTPEGLLVILRGPVTARIGEETSARELAGNRAFTWVDELIRKPVETITITGSRSESAITAAPHTDLREGVVPAGGFVIRRGTAPPVSSTQPAPAAELLGVGEQTTELLIRLKEQADAAPSEPVVRMLISAEGATYPLDRPYVVGRNPINDASVREAKASPIFVTDDRQISRVHAYVTVDEGAVMVRDAGTPAGTFVAGRGENNWTRLGTSARGLGPLVKEGGANVISFSNDEQAAQPGVWIMGIAAPPQVRRVVDHALSAGIRRFAAFAPQTTYGDQMVRTLQGYVAQRGGQIVATELFPENLDLTPAAKRLSDAIGICAVCRHDALSDVQPELGRAVFWRQVLHARVHRRRFGEPAELGRVLDL